MTFGVHSRLFQAQSSAYASFRPSYQEVLYEAIFKFSTNAERGLALDVGTGTGQVAARLAQSFEKVVAVDPSESQIKHAVQLPNVEYLLGPGEHLPQLAAGSVDLATAAQCLHWLHIRSFYREMRRVLRPTGTLAVWGYGLSEFPPQQTAANVLLQDLYEGQLGPYWDSKRVLVEQHYSNMEPTQDEFRVVERRELVMELKMTLDHLVGYLTSWSAYQTYLATHPDRADPLVAFRDQLKQVLLSDGTDLDKIDVRWPIFLILAKEPVPLAGTAADT